MKSNFIIKIPKIIILITLLLSIITCKPKVNNNTEDDYDTLLLKALDSARAKQIVKIFYNVPTPTEMASFIERTNSSYYVDLLNPIQASSKYETSAKIALNIGVYGVDLSYSKVFHQQQQAIKYLSILKDLSGKLGIPQSKAVNIFGKVEENITNSDSLLNMLNNSYLSTINYLKENERESTATLILIGGWTESIFLATNIYDRELHNDDILNRILVQKFSLNSIIEMASKYQKDSNIEVYYNKLRDLKRIFDKIEFEFGKDEVKIDTIRKIITLKGKKPIEASPKIIDEIKNEIEAMRSLVVK